MMHPAALLAPIALLLAGHATAWAKPKLPKGYILAEVEVTDPQAYAVYARQAGPVMTACGGRYLARGGAVEGLEGPPPAARFVIVEFASLAKAEACYRSPAYQALAAIRQSASRSRFWLSEGLPR